MTQTTATEAAAQRAAKRLVEVMRYAMKHQTNYSDAEEVEGFAAIIAAEFAPLVAKAENKRLREALELLSETCEEHRVRYNEQSASIFGHAPSAQEYWSGRRDEAGHLRDKLLAALAASSAPETGEREVLTKYMDAGKFERQIRAAYGVEGVAFSRPSPAIATTQTDEREAVVEALLQWATSPEEDWLYWDFEEQKYFCAFCGNKHNNYREVDHATDCLHLRAKALRASGEGEG